RQGHAAHEECRLLRSLQRQLCLRDRRRDRREGNERPHSRRSEGDRVVAAPGGSGRQALHVARAPSGGRMERPGRRNVRPWQSHPMSPISVPLDAWGVLQRHSRWDALLVALALAHSVVLLAFPVAPVIALGVWWNSNTVAHYAIHAPFFSSRRLNSLFGLYLSGLLGIPQTVWRERHLAHHAVRTWTPRWSIPLLTEITLVLAFWAILASLYPRFFWTAYVPGYAAGLAL